MSRRLLDCVETRAQPAANRREPEGPSPAEFGSTTRKLRSQRQPWRMGCRQRKRSTADRRSSRSGSGRKGTRRDGPVSRRTRHRRCTASTAGRHRRRRVWPQRFTLGSPELKSGRTALRRAARSFMSDPQARPPVIRQSSPVHLPEQSTHPDRDPPEQQQAAQPHRRQQTRHNRLRDDHDRNGQLRRAVLHRQTLVARGRLF